MTTIVKAANAAQFLSLVPKMLGYRPSRSLVLIPFAGSRSIGAMRFDLPSAAESDEIDRIASTLIGMVCRLPDADAVAAVAYTDETLRRPRDAAPRPHRGARAPGRSVRDPDDRRAVRRRRRLGLALRPAAARRRDDPSTSSGDEPRGAEHLAVAEGDQAAGSELPHVDLAEKERTARALRALEDAVRLLCGPESAAPRSRERLDRPRAEAAASADDAPDGRRVDPQALADGVHPRRSADAVRGGAGVGCRDPRPVRRGRAHLVPRPSLAARHRARAVVRRHVGRATRRSTRSCAGSRARSIPPTWRCRCGGRASGRIPTGSKPRSPSPDASRRPRRARCAPAPLATCGWLAWALGRSTHAERYAMLACEIEPEHGLAEIVRSFVLAGHLPDWAFRRRSPVTSAGAGLT